MLAHDEAAFLGDLDLALLDCGVEELFDPAALQADQVVVVLSFIQFEYRLAGFEMVALQQARLLELGQHAIHGLSLIHI